MPELPEVETVIRCLTPVITGRKVALVEVLADRQVVWSGAAAEDLSGRHVVSLARRGKWIVINLDGGLERRSVCRTETIEPSVRAGKARGRGMAIVTSRTACPPKPNRARSGPGTRGGEGGSNAAVGERSTSRPPTAPSCKGGRGATGVKLIGALAFAIHLRMSGRLYLGRIDQANRHTRCVWHFEEGEALLFDDPRRFGRIHIGSGLPEAIHRLGPEPLDPGFDGPTLRRMFQSRKRGLKALLLDQEFLAGMGNIYADEALHRAGLHPEQAAHKVSLAQSKRLAKAIVDVLNEAITHQGTSFDAVYRGGRMQERLRVYGRRGQPCHGCARPLDYKRVGGRGSTFCPRCQRR